MKKSFELNQTELACVTGGYCEAGSTAFGHKLACPIIKNIAPIAALSVLAITGRITYMRGRQAAYDNGYSVGLICGRQATYDNGYSVGLMKGIRIGKEIMSSQHDYPNDPLNTGFIADDSIL